MSASRHCIIMLVLLGSVVVAVATWAYPKLMTDETGASALLANTLPSDAVANSQQANVSAQRAAAPEHDPEAQQKGPELPASTPTVTFDRGPQRPSETDADYQRRRTFVTRFDAFLAASRLPDSHKRGLLLALYDYQQTYNAAIHDTFRDAANDYEARRDAARAFGPRLEDADHALAEAILRYVGFELHDLWLEHCSGCYFYLIEDTEDSKPILRIEE